MEKVELSRIVERLESGSREKGGSIDTGVISIGGTHLNNNGGFKWDKEEFVSEDYFLKMRSGKVHYQDILIVKDGATTGKTSFVGEDFPYKKAAINEHVFRLEINQNLANPKYVFYFLHSPTGQEQIQNDFRGATVGGISRGFIDKVEIPLPDLETQNKIVAILDKAKAILDKREETIMKYDELLKATFLDMFGDPILNPKHWQKQKLEEITTKITDGKHGDCEDELNSGFYFISAKDLLDGKINYNGVREITEKDFIETHRRTNLQINDILIGNTGASIGKLAIVTDEVKAARTTFQKSVAIVTVNEKIITPSFLYSYLLPNRDYLEKISSGSGQKNLLLSQLRNLEIITPPLELQQRFTSIVFKIENLKQKHKIQLQESQNLYKALSQLSFKGELDFNIAVDLEVLLENDYQFFKENSNSGSIKLLIERLNTDELNENRFYEQQTYDKAKSFVFELIKEGKVKQVFDEKTKKVKLTV